MNARMNPASRQRGVTMLEVLVTLLIVTLGLLGTAGMQGRLQTAQIESYQRAQAIVLLQDMVDRINANRKNAASYATASPLGTGDATNTLTTDCTALTTQAARDMCTWSQILQGASETTGGAAVGAMIGARGCVEVTAATMPRELKVSVVWQGLSQTRAPTGTTCGLNAYGDELARRAMVTYVKIGCLQNDVTTGVCVTP